MRAEFLSWALWLKWVDWLGTSLFISGLKLWTFLNRIGILVCIIEHLKFSFTDLFLPFFDLFEFFCHNLSGRISFFVEPFKIHDNVLNVALKIGSHLLLFFELFSALIELFLQFFFLFTGQTMHMVFNLLNVSGNLDLKVSVLGSQFDNFSFKNRSFVSEVNFLLIKFLNCVTMVNGFLKAGNLLSQMLVVRIRL